MTTRALSKKPRKFTLKNDVGKDDIPIFKIRSVDIFEVADITGDINVAGADSFKATLKTLKEYLKLGLLGWENLKDADGEIVSFKHDNFSLLPLDVITEITNEISGQLSVKEAGNLEPPS